MSEAFNELSHAEDERLTLLIEEMAEAMKEACKIQRHGYSSYHPTEHKLGHPTNRERLAKELGDVRYAVELLQAAMDVNRLKVLEAAQMKSLSIRPWLHHQPRDLLNRVEEMFHP